MKKRIMKIATLATAAVALVVVTVLVTVAYLTSFSTVSNTFTVGQVGIHMYESSVDNDGKAIDDTSKNGLIVTDAQGNYVSGMKDSAQNTYTLIPGKTYDKDPSIYVTPGSTGAYLFVVINNEIKDIEVDEIDAGTSEQGDGSIVYQMTQELGWKKLDVVSQKGEVFYYVGLGGTSIKEVGPGCYDVFKTFTIEANAVTTGFVDKKVELTAYAIQTDTFENDAEGAWAAIVATYPEAGSAVTP